MALHSSILAWKTPWTEEPGRLLGPLGHKEFDMAEQLSIAQSTIQDKKIFIIPQRCIIPISSYFQPSLPPALDND